MLAPEMRTLVVFSPLFVMSAIVGEAADRPPTIR